MRKLNLGAGSIDLPDYESFDGATGDSLFPLDVEDGSCEEIRASHVLEHFSHLEVATVVKHWVSKLAPGGRLRIAVPNFQTIAEDYLAGKEFNIQGYTFGGHCDARDHHQCAFDVELLRELLLDCGIERLHEWTSELNDCAALPVSLNLGGYKPIGPAKYCANTVAVLSAPRFGPVLHFRCSSQAFGKARVPYQIGAGAYWQQVLCEIMEQQIAEPSVKYVITCDYDTVFCHEDVLELYRLMEACPEADAIFPLESKRASDHALFGIVGKDGKPVPAVSMYRLSCNLLPVTHGHFGLTIFRADSLRSFARPWMVGTPNDDGRWGAGKIDADIEFWYRWKDSGRTLFLAPRVVVGHLQEMVTWPGADLKPIYQSTNDYDAAGMPQGARR
jgi:predicted SAM-dependent methyltransferase